LAANCIAANRGVIRTVVRDLVRGMHIRRKNSGLGGLQFIFSILTGPGLKLVKRAWNRLLMVMGRRSVCRIDGIGNMVETSHALTLYLRDNGYCFWDCIKQDIKNNNN